MSPKAEKYLTWLEIDLEAVRRNFLRIRKRAGKSGIMAVVKADAYGHGAVPVAKLLSREGVDALAVANVNEARELRVAGLKKPIVILSSILPEQVSEIAELKVIPTISDFKMASCFNEIGRRLKRKMEVQIKIDTGMGRLGIDYKEAGFFLSKISRELNFIEVKGLFTHLASADERNKRPALHQLEIFQKAVKELKKEMEIPWIHAANSAAILDLPESFFNMVRPGLILYGYYPSEDVSRSICLKPAMSLKSKVILVKKIKRGQTVGYGRTWKAKKDTSLAVLPVGYAMGYSRSLSNKAEVIIHGRKCPLIGRICMDLIMAEIPDTAGIKPGNTAILIGKEGGQTISLEAISSQGGTIPYELACLLGKALPRIYNG